ncbi:MAG: helix-turn-helix transcriptional regulator [Cryobacterium sp.]|nr:helix-turn-helix transcriptional regulator [Cryobacterium sp.]MBX3089756.1 helix-turn-helix transcriptional regulator [Cryobacterium sp.]MBX3116097.1 helix-turn-helix transcriptional regulator [Cryobacterium sp.]
MSPAIFAHGHLRLYLLNLLAEGPKHGYELILALENRFGGTYTPSAGTIYPRLAKLEEEGMVEKEAEGRKTIYRITKAGESELQSRRHEIEDIEDDVTDSIRKLADDVRQTVDHAMKSLRADLAAAAREARAEAREAERQIRVDSRQGGLIELREAEIALNEFRSQVRVQFRSLASSNKLTAEKVAELKSGLSELRSKLGG